MTDAPMAARDAHPAGPVVVVMGVAGCGKSTLGAGLAHALGVPFLEGDTLHDADNRRKMAEGVALTDDDRRGWLGRVGAAAAAAGGDGLVVSCSALKRSYRQALRSAEPALRFIHLDVSRALASARVAARAGAHYFPPALIASQFEALEPPLGEPHVLVLDGALPMPEALGAALQWLRDERTARTG